VGLIPGEKRDATGKWTVGGSGGTARQQAAARRGKTAKSTAPSGANDLYHIAQAAGISEARLLQLNPGLRKLAGTGRSVPKGVTVATTAAAAKAAARSQASRGKAITARAGRGRTKLAAASAARKTAAAKRPRRKG
jgi:hypothetical protein